MRNVAFCYLSCIFIKWFELTIFGARNWIASHCKRAQCVFKGLLILCISAYSKTMHFGRDYQASFALIVRFFYESSLGRSSSGIESIIRTSMRPRNPATSPLNARVQLELTNGEASGSYFFCTFPCYFQPTPIRSSKFRPPIPCWQFELNREVL